MAQPDRRGQAPAGTPAAKRAAIHPCAWSQSSIRTCAHAAGGTHKVAPGETLYSIARTHDVDVAQLRNWNHLSGNTVRPGQVLRLSAR